MNRALSFLLLGSVAITFGCNQTTTEPSTATGGTNTKVSNLVFNVEGLTWGAVSGLGWGSRLAPVLEQLDKVTGVESSMANHSGSLVRVKLDDQAKPDEVATKLEKILQEQKRKPKQLLGEELVRAIRDEQWRTRETVGQLSELEFRTILTRRVEEFSKSAQLGNELKTRLIEVADEVLSETAPTTHDTDWSEYRKDLTSRMLDKAKGVLDGEQFDKLAEQLKSKVVELKK